MLIPAGYRRLLTTGVTLAALAVTGNGNLAADEITEILVTSRKKEEALLAKVLQDVSGLIQKVSKDRGYGLVLERQRSSILYATPESDLTDDVLRAYDDETKKAGGKK